MQNRPPQSAAPRGIFDESKPLWQVMAIFLIPLTVSNLLQSASGTVTSIYIGRLIGVDGLAATSALFPVLFFLISFLIGLTNGSTVLIGQAFGARDEHRLKQVAGTTVTVCLLLGIGVAIVGTLFAHQAMTLLGTPPNILAASEGYAKLIFLGLPFAFVFIGYVTFLRGTADATTPLVFLILTTIISLLITPAFIRGWFGLPQLGVGSAGLAFDIANTVGLISLIIYLRAVKHPLALDTETIHNLRIRWPIFVQLVRIGFPTGIQVVMVSLSEVAVITFVNHFGSSATAAYGAVNQIVSYVQFPAISISIAASIFGAQAIGAKREDLLRRVVHAGVALNYAVGAVLIGLCYIFSNDLVSLFITNPNTVAVAHGLLMITLWGYLIFGNSAVLSGIMRASGTVLWPTLNGIFSIWAVEVPVAYVLSRHIGIDGIWYGYPAAFCVALTLQTLYYTFVWKRQRHEMLLAATSDSPA
jgi:putative MATE family efflux protein